jgi:hypothetical protein
MLSDLKHDDITSLSRVRFIYVERVSIAATLLARIPEVLG